MDMIQPMETTDATCRVCGFWKRDDGEANAGTCRRHAPVIADYRIGDLRCPMTTWPPTKEGDACGDFVVSTAAFDVPE
jgi:hypothetical protein